MSWSRKGREASVRKDDWLTMATHLDSLLQHFLRERKYLRNVSPETIEWYQCAWKAFRDSATSCLTDPAQSQDIYGSPRVFLDLRARYGRLRRTCPHGCSLPAHASALTRSFHRSAPEGWVRSIVLAIPALAVMLR
jgi:hypothetical protein